MCSLSIAPRQACAQTFCAAAHHFELWPVGRPGAAEEQEREGWSGWLEPQREGGWGGVFGPVSFLSHFVLFRQVNTHTHTHTLLSGHHQGTHLHCNYITLFFLLFFLLKWKKKLYNYLFIYSFVYLLAYLFVRLSIYLLAYLLIYSFVCLFTWKMSFLPPGILHRFLCLHNYVKKKAFLCVFLLLLQLVVSGSTTVKHDQWRNYCIYYLIHSICTV